MEHDSTLAADHHRATDGPLTAIPTDAIEGAYDDRSLDHLSDTGLVEAVAAVVAEPREGPADSFVLHAPLELTARARLLARTPASHRRMARLRLVSIAARYQTHQPAELPLLADQPAGAATAGPDDLDGALAEVLATIERSDLPGVDLAVQHLVALDPDPASVVPPLAAAIAARTAAAAHGSIFLSTLALAPAQATTWLPLLRPLARELARRPDWAMGWIERADAVADTGNLEPGVRPVDASALFQALAEPPRLGIPGSSFIHPLVMQVDAPGVADAILGPIVGPEAGVDTGVGANADAARVITRIAALAMIRDDPDHAPYGWTHCLTIPHAVLTVAAGIDRAGGHALAVAATQALAFRAAQGSRALDPDDELIRPADPATAAARAEALIVEAAERHDAHVAKYILTSLDAAAADPDAAHLHLTAAEHLLAAWDAAGPDPDDLLRPMG